MRADAALYQLTAATTLPAVLQRMADEPGEHTPMAGGTELMVAFNSGRLQAHSLISIGHLPELRFIRVLPGVIEIGAGTTFTDIRRHAVIAKELPLLERAASWTGSVANQNRATIGGNLCNASPAADTPPALLAYDAEVRLVSSTGERTLPYREFHLGYKRTALRPDELLYSISIGRSYSGWQHFIRKVGARNAQAISKIALAGVARIEDERVTEIRLGAASLADRPLRLQATERSLRGVSLASSAFDEIVRAAKIALASEVQPIDDIRSTARYREAVAANLVEEFVRGLAG